MNQFYPTLIGFVNIYLPILNSRAGSKYFSPNREEKNICYLLGNTIDSLLSYGCKKIYCYVDICDLPSPTEAKKILKKRFKGRNIELTFNQITQPKKYLEFLNYIKEVYGDESWIFYSGNHDHVLINKNFNAKKFFKEIKIDKKNVLFPSHYAEFIGLKYFDQKYKYIGFRNKFKEEVKSFICCEAKYLFSFMICHPSLLKKAIEKNLKMIKLPRIDWFNADHSLNHICYFPKEEHFRHSDGYSNIGIDNLISQPFCEDPNEKINSFSEQSIYLQENLSFKKIVDKEKVITLRNNIFKNIKTQKSKLKDFQRFNSFIFHKTNTANSFKGILKSIIILLSLRREIIRKDFINISPDLKKMLVYRWVLFIKSKKI